MTSYDTRWIKDSIIGKLMRYFGVTLQEASDAQLYTALSTTVRDQLMQKWLKSRGARHKQSVRTLYYLSVEFLMGRTLNNNISNLMQSSGYAEACEELGISFNQIAEQEPEPGLGNGGLGRLAACFLDSLATLQLPAIGCSIRYEYGLFRQRIIDGYQMEMPDSWLDNGNIWEIAVPEDQQQIRFGGRMEEYYDDTGEKKMRHVDYSTVLAVPYDVPIIGYDGEVCNTLRLWSARAPKRMDMESFNRGEYTRYMDERDLAEVISKVLYPEDRHYEGRELRLKQHYFLVSATVQQMVASYKRNRSKDLRELPQYVAMHINDTHPGLAIPELMRVLIDDEGMEYPEAESIVNRVFAYTNHTVMAEALEKWPEDMLARLIPRIYEILKLINESWCQKLWNSFPGQWDRIGHMAIIAYDQVHMANLCVAMTHSVNGVSQLHAEILKHNTFADFYLVDPDKFSGITNGITHRRWLVQANPGLTSLIKEAIGDRWIKEPERLEDLLPMRADAAFCEKFFKVKRANKAAFSNWIMDYQGTKVDPDTLFDVQAKRLHEYKRQLLNALNILALYNRICADPGISMAPRTFIFSAKAAPGYTRAKLIIKFICSIAEMIRKHPRASRMISVVFLENYGVTPAEHLIPSADLSEQISTAGKEASGTGNMKFMMNGAITIGTLDGANVEISEAVGTDNIFLFGLRSEEVDALYRYGTYHAGDVYASNPILRGVMEQMIDGTLAPENPRLFQELYQALLWGDGGGMADPYLLLKDFDSYHRAQQRANDTYEDRKKWLYKAVTNTAMSGVFSSDRTINEYNEKIWRLNPLIVPKDAEA